MVSLALGLFRKSTNFNGLLVNVDLTVVSSPPSQIKVIVERDA